jgi:large subunit ribosomal protein L25
MTVNIVSIKAEKRENFGSKFNHKLRTTGFIPAKIDRCDNEHIVVEESFFTTALLKRTLISHMFDIEINGVIERVVLKDYQKDPVSGKIINLDFVKIHKDKYIKLRVPLFYINKAKAIAIKKGAFLNVSRFFINLEYLGEEIVPYFVVDLDATDVLWECRTDNLPIPKTAKVLQKNELLANFRGNVVRF